MKRQFSACQTIYFKQFPSYSNRKCKKSPFSRTAAHIFVSPGNAPAIITQYVAWMERQFNACQIPRCMYLSIFNSFRVIRCQCVSPKIVIFITFLFPPGLRVSDVICLNTNNCRPTTFYDDSFTSTTGLLSCGGHCFICLRQINN